MENSILLIFLAAKKITNSELENVRSFQLFQCTIRVYYAQLRKLLIDKIIREQSSKL